MVRVRVRAKVRGASRVRVRVRVRVGVRVKVREAACLGLAVRGLELGMVPAVPLGGLRG